MWPRSERLKVYQKTGINKIIPYCSCHRLFTCPFLMKQPRRNILVRYVITMQKRSEILKNHVKSVHQGARYPCYKCHYEEKLKGNLRRHTKNVHKGIHYACDLCNYKAGEKQCLQEHIMSIK